MSKIYPKGRTASVVLFIPMRTIEVMKSIKLPVVVEKAEDGFFVASCPILKGCYSQGNTYDEVIKNIKEAISLYLEDMEANHEELPKSDSFGLLTVEITI